jgi:hypothetical protein
MQIVSSDAGDLGECGDSAGGDLGVSGDSAACWARCVAHFKAESLALVLFFFDLMGDFWIPHGSARF